MKTLIKVNIIISALMVYLADEEELASVNGQYKIIKTIRLEVPKDLGDRHLIIVGKNNG